MGAYLDAGPVWHGFLLSKGKYATLDEPNAGAGAYQGTAAVGINNSGQIVGYFTDATGINHGFLLSGGRYSTIDDPNASGTTYAADINASGQIVGYYTDAAGVNHGFLLNHGRYITIDDPNAGTGAGQGTIAYGINADGETVGVYYDGNGLAHGFQATSDHDAALGVAGNPASANVLDQPGSTTTANTSATIAPNLLLSETVVSGTTGAFPMDGQGMSESSTVAMAQNSNQGDPAPRAGTGGSSQNAIRLSDAYFAGGATLSEDMDFAANALFAN